MKSYSIGIDIGGTFTDSVLVDSDGSATTAKTLSTHSTSPVHGVLNGLELLAEARGHTLDELLSRTSQFNHGTTIGTNLVVERNGARVGLITSAGHGDSFVMMRGAGRTTGVSADRLFDAHHVGMPTPLLPRHQIVEVNERVGSTGMVLAPLDDDDARHAIRELLDSGVHAIAVCLLWSTANPAHERRVAGLIHELAPDMFVSLSSDVSHRRGEYERSVAAVVNSYVGPASQRYLAELEEALAIRGLTTPPYIMQASGGVAPVDEARKRPLHTIGSGPAGGLAGIAAVAAAKGDHHVVATDMGGTSFEVGLVIDGKPTMTSLQVLDKYTYHSTHLDLRSIACGGGSIASVDPHSGALRVGPRSAGSSPGPACYGVGTEATVTDADLVLGLLSPDTFLGGRMKLDMDAAWTAIERIADQIGLSVEETAAGIVQINAHAAATLIRQRTIEQGMDPRDFVVYAYGGAGPVHAFAIARELGVERVVIPLGNGASTLSGFGAASSDLTRTFEADVSLPSPFSKQRLEDAITNLESLAVEEILASGVSRPRIALDRVAVMRYSGQQEQELHIHLPNGSVDEEFARELENMFASEYARLYSAAALSLFQTIEIVSVKITARVTSGAGKIKGDDSVQDYMQAEPISDFSRVVNWPGGEKCNTPVFADHLPPGAVIQGPAIVELPHTTVAVADGQCLQTDMTGSLTLFV